MAAAAVTITGSISAALVPEESESHESKRSLACLQRLYVKNGGKRLNVAKEGAALKQEIDALVAKIRAAKEAKVNMSNPREWWLNIRKLLQLKYDANLFLPDAPAVAMTKPGDLFTEIKLRWLVKLEDGSTKRLQRLVQCRYSLTAPELLSIVTEFTAARYPQIGAPLEIAVRADLLDIALKFPKNAPEAKSLCPDPQATRTLCLDDVLSVPLEFPGPCLPNSTTIDLDVTFATPPSNVTTPSCYTTEDQKVSLPQLVDAGVNLCEDDLKEHPLAVLREAASAGVSQAIALSVDMESSRFNVLAARSAVGKCFAAVGIHPTAIPKDTNPDVCINELAEMIGNDSKREDGKRMIVAIGEIGLDYEKEGVCAHDEQMRWFAAQVALAKKFELPIILHLRGEKAIEDGLAMLRSGSVPGSYRGSVNCFNGTFDQMQALTELGFYITWTGLLCNSARAEVLRDVASRGKLERYLVGSDAPQLIPFNMPKPYPKCNRPCTLPHVAALLAQIMKMPVEQVASVTTANARAAFKLPSIAYNGALPATGIAYDGNMFVEEPLITMAKKPSQPNIEQKGKNRLRILTDEEVAALVPEGMKAFVDDGCVYLCSSGISSALEVMRSTKNPALKESLKDFVEKQTITLIYDPHVHKHKRNSHSEARGVHSRIHGRSVRPRVERRGGRAARGARGARGGRGGRGGARRGRR